MRWARVRAGLVVAGGLVGAACGGSGSGPTATPTPTPVPTPLPPVIVAQRTAWALPANYIGWQPFPTSRGGLLEATVDWTSEANDLNAYLVKGECNYDQLDAGQCDVLVVAETRSKPETFRYESPQASTYTLFITNEGPADESLSFQVVLRATLAGSARDAVPAPAAPPAEAQMAPRRGVILR